ncbi:MAG TPA: ParB/RepB/Spo0J family partition protein [Gemmatimonadaceae bacterium]|nr:ParB/RepB/Spo0J family partition protein [Gemmatimonadaceae bacterium]
MSADKQRRLGRGLEALLAVTHAPAAPAAATATAEPATPPGGDLRRIPTAEIRPNPYQPRKAFRPEELADLEASLKSTGLLQPVTVRRSPGGDGYELVAGERRLRAAARLGWAEIPAIVRDLDDRTLLTLALVENLQRSDLNPLEEAEGYQRLIDEFGLTQQQVADVVAKDRSTIANMLRVLHLPAAARRMLQEGQLSLGHARALLALGDERAILEVAREVVARGLSVRDVEQRARETSKASGSSQRSGPPADTRSPEARRIEDQLRQRLQTDVELVMSGKDRGTIRIPFYSADDLERLLDVILGPAREPY